MPGQVRLLGLECEVHKIDAFFDELDADGGGNRLNAQGAHTPLTP